MIQSTGLATVLKRTPVESAIFFYIILFSEVFSLTSQMDSGGTRVRLNGSEPCNRSPLKNHHYCNLNNFQAQAIEARVVAISDEYDLAILRIEDGSNVRNQIVRCETGHCKKLQYHT